jgi:hypothetical protein
MCSTLLRYLWIDQEKVESLVTSRKRSLPRSKLYPKKTKRVLTEISKEGYNYCQTANRSYFTKTKRKTEKPKNPIKLVASTREA